MNTPRFGNLEEPFDPTKIPHGAELKKAIENLVDAISGIVDVSLKINSDPDGDEFFKAYTHSLSCVATTFMFAATDPKAVTILAALCTSLNSNGANPAATAYIKKIEARRKEEGE